MNDINKDTEKAIESAKILMKYCARYKQCGYKCIFYQPTIDRIDIGSCAINRPCKYGLIPKENKKRGGDHVKK